MNLRNVAMGVVKQTNWVTELGDELDLKHWRKLSPQHTDEALAATFRAAIGEAELRVPALTGVSQETFRRGVFDRGKTILVE
jgi:hypothetical protein